MKLAVHKDLPQVCPVCGKTHDAVTSVDPANPNRPVPGDVTVCTECISVVVFDENLQLRLPTTEDMQDMAGDPRLKLAVEAAHRRKQHGGSAS